MTHDADRIADLEIRLAHQDQAIEDLNAVILKQSEEITRLTRRLDKMLSQIQALEDSAEGPENRPPPHY